MNKDLHLTLMMMLAGVCLISFQNCGGASEGIGLSQKRTTGTSSNQDASCLVDKQCYKDKNAISISIANSSIDVPTGNNVIDVSGFCDAGNYDLNRITYTLLTATGAVHLGETDATSNCNDIGRFWIQVNVGSMNLDTQDYQIRVKIYGVDQSNLGQAIDNPTGTNVSTQLISRMN